MSITPKLICVAAVLASPSLVACASIPPGHSATDSVEIRGARAVSEHAIEEKIATMPSPRFFGLWSGVVFDYEIFDPFVLERDLARVERFYRARGFYEAHARAGRIVHTRPDHVAVTIVVEEGPASLIDHVYADGWQALPRNVAAAVARAIRVGGMTHGRRFDEDDFAGTEWRIRRALEDRGYAYAKVERRAEVDLTRNSVDVFFTIHPDQPAVFGRVTIVGLGSIPEEPVRRALDIPDGGPYSASALDTAQQAALDLGVFASVIVTPTMHHPPPPDHVVPITVTVQPTRLRSVRLGGGLEIDVIKTDVHALAGWQDRNFLGGLRRFDVSARPGVVPYPTRLPDLSAPQHVLLEGKSRLELRQPGLVEARTSGVVSAELNVYPVLLSPNVDPDAPVVGYRELRAAVGADRTYWKLYASLSYDVQRNDPLAYLGTLDPDLSSVTISYVDLQTNLDFRDDRVHPHSGLYVGNDLQLAGGVLRGDADDVRVQPEVRGYVPLGHATLALRASTGLLFPLDYGDIVQQEGASGAPPPGSSRASWVRDLQRVYFRGFFSGGPSSNRGYPIRSVGPHGPLPFYAPGAAPTAIAAKCVPGTRTYDPGLCQLPLGGLSLWEASAELRIPVGRALEIATFCDASDVSLRQIDVRLDRPHLSCGAGARYDTPVGPIRLDAAYRVPGLNPAAGEEGNPGTIFGAPVGVSFGIGEAF
jgi:outer membrane protein insertion porin family/translocation and assembly module TamA